MANEVQTYEEMNRDQRRNELGQLSYSDQGGMFRPRNGLELLDMSKMLSTAGPMIKDIFRNQPGACLGLISICAPYGLNPIQVSWKAYRASKGDDAPIAFESQVIIAMINASGAVKGGLRYRFEGEGQKRFCIAYGTLVGTDEVLEVRSPPLSDIKPQNSPLWKTDPDQQLSYYTGRNWVRRYKPEMLLGVYDVDELPAGDYGKMRDVTPAPKPVSGLAAVAAKAAAERASAGDDTTQEVQAEQPEDAPTQHWTATYDPKDAFPGSNAWYSGESAGENPDGKLEDCPHEPNTQEADDWIGGFLLKRKAME